MGNKPVVDDLLNAIQKLYRDGYAELWTSYQGSIGKLNKTDLNAILHFAVRKHDYLRGKRYGTGSASTLYDIISSLLDHGADPNPRGRPMAGAQEPKVIRLLLRHGASPNARSYGGHTALTDFELEAEAVKILLDAGADPNASSDDGYTPLRAQSNSKCLGLLLKAGADPNQRDAEGKTVIMSEHDGPAELKILLQGGADPNARDKQGRTPLMFVYEPESVKVLKAHGADFKARDNEGRTVLMHALVIDCQNSMTIEEMIKAGAPVNELDKHGNCVLSLSGRKPSPWNSDAKFINVLLTRGATPDLPNGRGETPLMHWAGNAENKECRKIVELLLKHGADIHLRDNRGMDALMHAAKNGNQRVIKLLCSKKADPTRTSKSGRSCLEWALSAKKLPDELLVDVLLEGGANINGNLKSRKLNLLGKFLLGADLPYGMSLLKRGAKVNRATLSTMGISLEGLSKRETYTGASAEPDSPLEKLLAFSRLDPGVFCEAIDSEDAELVAALKQLAQKKPRGKKRADNPLGMLEPHNWPPFFPARSRIVVGGVKAMETEPQLNFTEEEFEDYYHGGYPYSKISGEKKTDADFVKKITLAISNNKRVAFSNFLRLDDQTIAELWNDFISRDTTLLRTRDIINTSGTVSISSQQYKFILARCGSSVMPGMLQLANSKTNIMCGILLPVSDSRLSSLMADRLAGSTIWRVARKWFLRHPEAAIHGLIPVAVGPLSKARDDCEMALRFLAANGFGAIIKKASIGFGKDVGKAVSEILSVDPCSDYHRKKLPDVPAGLFDEQIGRPVLRKTGEPLPDRCLPALYGMMSASTIVDVYPGLIEIMEFLDPDSLADFAWAAFQLWDNLESSRWGSAHKRKAKKEAEWAFHSLAYFGNDKTVKSLVPLIKSWPKEGGMPKAVTGLDILANIGSDTAIRAINAILLKTKYKPLLERAGEILETIADVRGLNREQLDDRLVPTLGLDEKGQMTLDFGLRTFSIQVDEKLSPVLLDPAGKALNALPKATKGDDKVKVKVATEQWKIFRTDLRVEASTQLLRLERAMIQQRRWTGSDFRALLAGHPLLRHVVSSLVWAEYEGDKPRTTFRVDKDGRLLTNLDEPVKLKDSAAVGIPHPLAIKSHLKSWAECLAGHKVGQAFPQIGRQCFVPKDDKNKDLFGVQGGRAPTKAFRGMKAKGWKPEIGDGGAIWSFSKPFSGGEACLEIDGIITMHDYGIDDEEKTISVSLPKKLAPAEYSELVRELKELLH